MLQSSSAAASSASGMPTSTELTALLAQVAGEIPAAFEDLYLLTQGTVLRITCAILRDRAQAEEVTQEVFLQIWAHASRFDASKGSAASWIWRIAHGRGRPGPPRPVRPRPRRPLRPTPLSTRCRHRRRRGAASLRLHRSARSPRSPHQPATAGDAPDLLRRSHPSAGQSPPGHTAGHL